MVIILAFHRSKSGIFDRGGEEAETDEAFSDTITQNPRMKELLSYVGVMARGGNSILITGEYGTGKELMARGIHRASYYAKGPFIPVHVSSVPETLFESEFFGHIQSAFTGPTRIMPAILSRPTAGLSFWMRSASFH